MADADVPAFDELVDILRGRLFNADALKPSEIHSFKELMADDADVVLSATRPDCRPLRGLRARA